ncbi:hypothetical protein L3X38_029605 [Prunus dulcis]|uniref:Uncharacterized protein n=1 Tax=Prunus dulcis TaxID=3755 RepID=A0AAD4VTX7_PRUDU|nr:hypothetical protein L3X38_029605 [Prunus dulcis]
MYGPYRVTQSNGRSHLSFRPERFLPGGEKPHVDVRGNDFEVIPFGAGRRICAGMSLGLPPLIVHPRARLAPHAYKASSS